MSNQFDGVMKVVAERLVAYRSASDLNLREAGERAGLAISTMSRVERAKSGDMALVTLLRLCLLYGCRPEDVLPTMDEVRDLLIEAQ